MLSSEESKLFLQASTGACPPWLTTLGGGVTGAGFATGGGINARAGVGNGTRVTTAEDGD